MSSSQRDSVVANGSSALLDDVIEEVADRLQAGEAVDGAAILARYPEHADSLRRLLPAIAVMAEFGVSASRLVASGVSPGLSPLATELGILGDFRVLREVGRGGMGIVYEAEQLSLHRRVALKVLPLAGGLDPRQLERFQTEAQAAALLHHTNIVPIHAVGCERGVHYYAMQFIDGQTLAALIADRRRVEKPQREGAFDRPRPDGESPGAPGQGRVRGPHSGVPGQISEQDCLAEDRRIEAYKSPRTSPEPAPRAPFSPRAELLIGEDKKLVDDEAAGRNPVAAGSPPTGKTSGSATPTPSSRTREFVRMAVTLGIQAAEALDYAHALGVVHRDIKPANLLLDAAGRLWITDFGLARIQDDAGLTMTGDLLGTLRYMSPEQALAKRGYLDHRTDIYSLGATLYELLTLRPAIEGEDRQDVLRKIAQEEPAPPRRINPSIPRELETILLKAMSKEAEGRYATAKELADDLQRFLEHKLIKAKRPTLAERVTKWSRRHSAAVLTAVVTLTLAAAGLVTAVVMIARERGDAMRQRDEARQAVDDMYTEVAEQWLSQQAALEPLQRKFLQKALDYYQRFTGDAATDANTRLKTAEAYRRVAEIQETLGNLNEARTACHQAACILQGIMSKGLSLRDPQYELATAERTLGRLVWATGRQQEAEDWTGRAIARMKQLLADAPGDARCRYELAMAYSLAGRFAWKADLRKAGEALTQAVALLEKLVVEFPSVAQYRSSLVTALTRLGLVHRDVIREDAAKGCFLRGIELSESLLSASPSSPDYLYLLALSLGNLAQLDTIDFSESTRLYRRAIEVEEKLVASSPSVPAYREYLAAYHGNFALHLGDRDREQSELHTRRAIEIFEKLVGDLPSLIPYQTGLALFRNNLGEFLALTGRLAEAEAQHRLVLSMAENMPGELTSAPVFQRELATADMKLTDLLVSSGRHVEAEKPALVGIALLEGLADLQSRNDLAWVLSTSAFAKIRNPKRAIGLARQCLEQRPANGVFWTTLGAAYYGVGDWKAAVDALSRADNLKVKGEPFSWFFLAMALCRDGEKERAQTFYQRAVDWIETKDRHDVEFGRFRVEAAGVLGMRALSQNNDMESAIPNGLAAFTPRCAVGKDEATP
jgi:serine/threonine protein kinase/Flp pilus assembly protein TadD